MQTNFFSQLATLNLTGNFRLNIQRKADNSLLVSALLVNDDIKDKSVKQIPPLVLSGLADDLDQGFFSSISAPVQKNNTLLCNLADHEKAIDKAKKDSDAKKTATSSSSGAKRRKFDEQMKKVTDLEAQKKYGQAITQLPKEKEYPEYALEINKKMQGLKGKHSSLSLFDQPDESGTTGTSTEENEPEEEEDFPEDGNDNEEDFNDEENDNETED